MASATNSDPGQLLQALGEPISAEALARLSPWRFAAPLSPDMAAAREGREIDFAALVKLCGDEIAAHHGTLFIEGVGGIMVPLDARHTVLDWMAALNVPLILVAGSYLGTLSHTLTALGMIAQAKLKLAALVINDSGDAAVPLEDTLASLRRFAPRVPVATIARVQAGSAAREDFARLFALL
jgi:dethiobiotin synthetase